MTGNPEVVCELIKLHAEAEKAYTITEDAGVVTHAGSREEVLRSIFVNLVARNISRLAKLAE